MERELHEKWTPIIGQPGRRFKVYARALHRKLTCRPLRPR